MAVCTAKKMVKKLQNEEEKRKVKSLQNRAQIAEEEADLLRKLLQSRYVSLLPSLAFCLEVGCKVVHIPSGELTWLWKITIFNG